jgi:hypothetical protein
MARWETEFRQCELDTVSIYHANTKSPSFGYILGKALSPIYLLTLSSYLHPTPHFTNNMAPSRLYVTGSASPFITTPATPYSTTRTRISSRRNRSASIDENSSHSAQSQSPTPSASLPKPCETPRRSGHKTTPSGSDLQAIQSNGFTKGHRRIGSKKLQARLANNALCTGFEENVAACILIELR